MKRQVTDFGILGGVPSFREPLIVGRPNPLCRDAFLKRVASVLDSGHLTNGGPMVSEFEHRIARLLGVRHVVAVCNGTAALQVMTAASGLTGEVIVPSMTFIATAHALQWIGLTPVFADIDDRTHTLAAASVEHCITDRTSAILGVHLWGNPCAVNELQQVAERHDLRLLFDASHAFGCLRGYGSVGSLGDAAAFSFHATKVMHAVEGGAVVTNDDEIAARSRLMRNFGITGLTQIESVGINAKMSELSAAAGLTSLESLPEIIDHNRENLQTYRSVIDGVKGLRVAIPPEQSGLNGHYAVIRVDAAEFGLSRDQLLQILRAEGVFARAYFVPGCHHAPPYAGVSVHSPVPLPVTERLLSEVLQLPTGGSVQASDIRKIGRLLTVVQQHSAVLHEQLRSAEIRWHAQDPARPAAIKSRDAA